MRMNRRGILLGLTSALGAPAIIHSGNLMLVKTMTWGEDRTIWSVLINNRSNYVWRAMPGNEIINSSLGATERIIEVSRYPICDIDRATELAIIRTPGGEIKISSDGPWEAWTEEAKYEGTGTIKLSEARRIVI